MKFKLGLLIVVLYFVAPKAFAFFGSSLIVPDATHFEAKFQQCRPKKRQRSTKKLLQATIQKILDRKTLKKVKKYSLKQRSDIAKATRLLKTSTEIYFKDYKSAFVENSYLSSCALERKITHEMRLSGWSVNRKNKKQMRRFRQAHEKRYLKLRQQMNLPYCKGEWRKKYSQLRLRISPVLKSMRLSMALMESHWLDTFNQKNRQAMLKKIKKGKLPLVCGVNNVSVTQNIEHARGLGFRESYVNVSDYFSAPGVHNSYLGTIPEITPLTPRELQRVKRKIQEDAEEFSRFVHLDALRLKELKKRKKKPKFLAPKMTPSLGPALNKGWSFLTQDISLCTRFKKALHTFYEARYFMAIEAFPILGYINQPHFDESSKKWLPSNNQMFDGLYDLRSRAFERLQELLFEEQKRQFRLKHIRVSHPRRGRVKLKVPATLEDVKGLSLKTVAWTQYLKWYKEDWSERRKAILGNPAVLVLSNVGVVLNIPRGNRRLIGPGEQCRKSDLPGLSDL